MLRFSLYAMLLGFAIDLILGDPHGFPHPVILMGKLIDYLNRELRKIFFKTPSGEKAAGAFLWLLVVLASTLIPGLLLYICHGISPFLRLIVESLMCWQILATKSLRDESMKVYRELQAGDIARARHAVSMIVGRDTGELDDVAITKATVETVSENTSDGIVAPLLFMALGGAPLGFFYKAVNTMDSMLGYPEPPYKYIGFYPAKMDDLFNYIPARVSALLMLLAGGILKMNVRNGWKIFIRDRYNHASPNAAQTESVAAGLLEIQLAGDAVYRGVVRKKKFIGDALKPIEYEDIPRSCRLSYMTAFLALILAVIIQSLLIV